MTTLQIGSLRLTRVLYLDAAVPTDRVGLDDATFDAPWMDAWLDGDQVRVGVAAWVVEHGDQRVVVDPMMAADEILHDTATAEIHRTAIIAAFDAAGLPIESITHVVFTHIEGIGFAAVRDPEWRAFFPNARVSVGSISRAEFAAVDGDLGCDAWSALFGLGIVDTFDDGDTIVPGMTVRHTGGHHPGHVVFDLGDGPDVTMVGHLAVSPLHLGTGLCPAQHPEPELAWDQLVATFSDGRLLIGPLWPSPGVARWSDDECVAITSLR
jgi:glyoxylase-like metal-dependent hydrolase (beta-lactamase superfamily II)